MKRQTRFLFVATLLLSLIFAACSSKSATTNGASQQGQDPSGNTNLPQATKLAVGTLKLEGTDQAVTAEQSANLLTLWQAYQALSNSDTTATAELDAVIKQIQAAMTPEQIKAIEDMQLTRQSMSEVLQSLGVDYGANPGDSGTPVARQGFQNSDDFPRGGGEGPGGGAPPDGGGPGGRGGFPADGGAGFGGQVGGSQATPDASTQATMQARFSNQSTRVSPMLLNALIKVLETKSQPSQ